MRITFNTLLQRLRHVVVGLAVVSVLMITLPVHVLAQVADVHANDHPIALSVGGQVEADSNPSACPDVTDPDGCGGCHCHAPSVMISELAAFNFHDQVTWIARLAHSAGIPDSLSYPPDLPPVRLS